MVLAREETRQTPYPGSFQAFEQFLNTMPWGSEQQARRGPRLEDRSAQLMAAVRLLDLLSPNSGADAGRAQDAGGDGAAGGVFSASELLALAAVLRRCRDVGSIGPDRMLTAGPIRLDPEAVDVSVEGRPVKLSPIQFRVLELLVRAGGKMVRHADIAREIWGDEPPANAYCLLKLHMRNLRQKLGDTGADGKFIVTVRSLGYKVRVATAAPGACPSAA